MSVEHNKSPEGSVTRQKRPRFSKLLHGAEATLLCTSIVASGSGIFEIFAENPKLAASAALVSTLGIADAGILYVVGKRRR